MARYKRLQVLNSINDSGLVPVFYHSDLETAKKIVAACYEGGSRIIELTNRGDGAIHIFSGLEQFCCTQFPDMVLGVGSVVDAPTAAMYIAEGAGFVVGPVLDTETAFLCNSRKIPYLPGCGSATEIHQAERLGVEICKIFPGTQVGGPAFVKAVLAPCPWTMLMPTGGVDITRESITAWFSAGVVAAGIGSKLITKELVKNENFSQLTENVRNVLKFIAELKSQ